MSTEQAIILGITCYKIGCLAVGTLFAFLGYRLFQSGIWGNAGDLETKFKDFKLILKNGTPGAFFALLGAAIVIYTIWHGMDFNLEQVTKNLIPSKSQVSLPEPKIVKP